ncbi:MAG: tetratricopeptide repeat protein [Candidatus Obscuribacterales bacterium]|nr:tetratricopeptide repeat protein [Candidatus Obscuribacterales bacterium]
MRKQGIQVVIVLSLSVVQLIGWTIPVFAQYQSYLPQSSYPVQAPSRQYAVQPQYQNQNQYQNQYPPQYQNQYQNNQSYQSAAPNIYGGQGQTNAAGQTYTVGGRPASQQSFQAAQLMTQAVNLLNQNQNNDALPLFEKALALAPDVAVGHSNYALCLAKLGRTDQAISELQKALAIDSNLPYALITLGGLYQSQGKLDLASQTYADFLNRFPTHPEAAKIKNVATAVDKMRSTGAGTVAAMPTAPNNDARSAAESKTASKNAQPANSSDYFAEVTSQSGVFKWPAKKMPVKVYIKQLSATEAASMPGYRANFPSILKTCFEDWAHASGGLIRFTYVDSSGADIDCIWTADASQFANSAEAGETRLSMSKSGKIVHGNIELLTVPMEQTLPLTDNRLRKISLHEVGHVLGLTGHTRNPDDIMFFTPVEIADHHTELKSRDINTLVRLYSTPQ